MILHDMNQSWTPPVGYTFVSLHPHGGYLLASFEQLLPNHTNKVVVFLNEAGREVARTEFQEWLPRVIAPPKPVLRRSRFLNGFYLFLAGLQEMIKWRKS